MKTAVIALLVAAVGLSFAGLSLLTEATFGVGLILDACFLAITARIAQAERERAP